MAREPNPQLRAVMQLTGTDRAFDNMVDVLLAKIRHSFGVRTAAEEAEVGPQLDQEIERIRGRMGQCRPDFQRMYGSLLLKHLGSENLEACAEALASPPMRRVFAATDAMAPELSQSLSAFFHRLGQTPLEPELFDPCAESPCPCPAPLASIR